jgi:hypothetical protein
LIKEVRKEDIMYLPIIKLQIMWSKHSLGSNFRSDAHLTLYRVILVNTHTHMMYKSRLQRSSTVPHLKTPFLTRYWIALPLETFQIYEEVVVEAQVLQGGEVEWAGPF